MSPNTINNSTVPCSVWIRFLCAMYDLFFVISLLFIVGFIWVLSLDAFSLTEHISAWLHTCYYLLWIIAYYAYFWYKGQTPAMHIWRLRFVNEQSDNSSTQRPHRLSAKQMTIRFLLAPLAIVTWVYCFFNQDRKSIIDYLCRQKIVRFSRNKK